MATRRAVSKKKAKAKPKRFDPTDPDYYKKLGGHGGKRNAKAHAYDPDYFAKLAILSHRKRLENKAEAERLAAKRHGK